MFTFFFFKDPATTEIYPLSLPDALPIFVRGLLELADAPAERTAELRQLARPEDDERDHQDDDQLGHADRSEEHTSELQSRQYLVCRLLLEKNKPISRIPSSSYKHYTLYH